VNARLNYQATSAPYSADNLKPHDKDLAWTMEFGTETTEATGDAFNTTDSGGPAKVTVNARMGMLQCVQDSDDPDTMSGSSFLLPPWSTWGDSPALGPDVKSIVLMAHVLLSETNIDDPSGTNGFLLLAAEDFVGNVDSEDCTTVGILGGFEEEASFHVANYGSGAGQPPTDEGDVEAWGTNLYFRLMILGDVDEEKQSEAFVWVSRDGLSWTFIDQTQISGNGGLRRVGLGVTGAPGVALLDWVRIYNYPLAGFDEDGGVLEPPMPITGGRLF